MPTTAWMESTRGTRNGTQINPSTRDPWPIVSHPTVHPVVQDVVRSSFTNPVKKEGRRWRSVPTRIRAGPDSWRSDRASSVFPCVEALRDERVAAWSEVG